MLTAFLIDDDPDDQDFFFLAMKKAEPDAHCTFAEDGPRAIEKLKHSSFTPQVIFIDINMPLMNGVECLRELRRIPWLSHVPTYMYSTSIDRRIAEQCLQMGATGILKKQISLLEAKKDFEHIITQLKLQKP